MEKMNIEKLLDELIAKASGPVIQKLTEEDLKHLDDAYPYEISEEHEKKMQEIFKMAGHTENSIKNNENEEQNKEENVNRSKTCRKNTFRKVLLIAAVIGIVLAMGCVGAFRESFVKYYLDIKEECSGVKKNNELYMCVVDNIRFGYMPSEFKIKTKKIDNFAGMIFFEKENNIYLNLDIQDSIYGKEINTEDAVIEDVVLNQKDAIYLEREDMKAITWKENGKTFVLYTNDTKELLLKVAENMSITD